MNKLMGVVSLEVDVHYLLVDAAVTVAVGCVVEDDVDICCCLRPLTMFCFLINDLNTHLNKHKFLFCSPLLNFIIILYSFPL